MSTPGNRINHALTGAIFGTSLTVLILTCGLFLAYETLTYRRNVVSGLTARAQIIAANSSAALAFQNEADAQEVLTSLSADPRVISARLFDARGSVFAKYLASSATDTLPDAAEQDGHRFEKGRLFIFHPVKRGNRLLGKVMIEFDLSALRERYRVYTVLVSLSVLGTGLLAITHSVWLRRRISEPILALSKTARTVADRRDYSQRATKQADDEIGLLTDSFNDMLSEIQQRDTALRRSELRTRAILDSALDCIVTADREGRILEFNPAAQKTFGYSREQALGRLLVETIIPPAFREKHQQGFTRYLATRESAILGQRIELTAMRSDGSEFPAELAISTAQLDDGPIFTAYLRDITEARRQQEVIASSLKEIADLKTALDEHAIVAITDPQGRITYVNDKFCAISKYSREELLGQDHRLINSGYHSKAFIRDLWTTIASGQVWHGEIKNRAKDGSSYWVDTTIVPFLKESGKPRQYVAIRSDITERKQAEEEIRELNAELEARVKERTVQLEAANKELEAFSYSISHDLRAPLRAVNGFADIVLEDFGPRLPEEGRRQLERIRNGGRRMGDLIDDLLSFSRLGRHPLKRQNVDTDALVQDALGELLPQRQGRQIELRIEKLPPCQGDPALLKQVWLNLLSNAIKYTRQAESAVIDVFSRTEGARTVFTVKDNGAGFDMQHASKLFGVFQRLHRADEFEGTGVGLAIVQRIVHRHGGRVWAEAEPGRGAAFHFTLEGEPQL